MKTLYLCIAILLMSILTACSASLHEPIVSDSTTSPTITVTITALPSLLPISTPMPLKTDVFVPFTPTSVHASRIVQVIETPKLFAAPTSKPEEPLYITKVDFSPTQTTITTTYTVIPGTIIPAVTITPTSTPGIGGVVPAKTIPPKTNVVKTTTVVQVPVPSNLIALDTGEYVYVEQFRQLSMSAQIYLRQVGIDTYNSQTQQLYQSQLIAYNDAVRYANESVEQQSQWLRANTYKLTTGEYVLKAVYDDLIPGEQHLLDTLGVAGFNATYQSH